MKYELIMACPPWKHFRSYRFAAASLSDQIPPKYQRALNAFGFVFDNLRELSTADHIFLVWAAGKHCADFKGDMEWREYRYHGAIPWVRPRWRPGSGEKTIEYLLVYSKGNIAELAGDAALQSPQGFTGKVRDRQHKPLDAYQWIDSLFPNRRKMQLYGADRHPGWTICHRTEPNELPL